MPRTPHPPTGEPTDTTVGTRSSDLQSSPLSKAPETSSPAASPSETRVATLEDALASQRWAAERLRQVIDLQDALICRVRPDLTLTLANKAFCRFLGRPPESLVGQPLDLGAPAEDRRFLEEHLAALDPAGGPALFEHRVQAPRTTAPSGELRWLAWRHTPILDANGVLVEIQGVGRDVTEDRRSSQAEAPSMEASPEGSVQTAGNDLQQLGRYASHIAHDFNNLLVGILGNARLALMDLSTFSPCRPLIQEVETAALRAAGLANQMLTRTGHLAEGERDTAKPLSVQAWRAHGNVLVVDDEEMVRTLAKRVLQKVGFRVIAAEDGRRALEVFRAHAAEITAVLLDMTMPGLDGEQTFHELRRLRPDIKVLLSSGYEVKDAVARLNREGLAGFIHKPYLPEELVQTLRAVLEDDAPTEDSP